MPSVKVIRIQMGSQGHLMQVVYARDRLSLLFGLGERGQQQGGQNGNDRDHHQQFDEREGDLPLKRIIRLPLPPNSLSTHYAVHNASSWSDDENISNSESATDTLFRQFWEPFPSYLPGLPGTFPAVFTSLLNCKSLIAFLAGTVALSPGLLTHAASPDFLWARPATNRLDIGHGGRSAARSVASDSLGNVFVAGEFTSTSIRFGGVALTNTTSGQGNFLCKYDPSGTLLWARLAGTNSGNRPLSVAVDASTNVYL